MNKYRIVSDGTRRGTHVYDAETGAEMKGVKSVTWKVNMEWPVPMVEIVLGGIGLAEIEYDQVEKVDAHS